MPDEDGLFEIDPAATARPKAGPSQSVNKRFGCSPRTRCC